MIDSELQQKRFAAAAIDIGVLVALVIIMVVMSVILGCLGARLGWVASYGTRIVMLLFSVIGLVYVLGRDSIGGDRSLGKQLTNIRVTRVNGEPISMIDGAKRNVIFAPAAALSVVLSFLDLIPFGSCLGCILMPFSVLAVLAALVAVVVELIKIGQERDGSRFGDNLAGTKVTW
jgi:hypothetical protein